jgi:hypothetical protein
MSRNHPEAKPPDGYFAGGVTHARCCRRLRDALRTIEVCARHERATGP